MSPDPAAVSNRAEVQSLDGLGALWRTFEYLFVHGIIILIVTAAALALGWFAVDNKDKKSGRLDLAAYCGAFATFGVATAYFLSQGLSAVPTADNGLLQTFAGPFIALLTAAVAYAASRSSHKVAKNELVLGLTCFLLSCILSYETFNGQIRHGAGPDPGDLPENISTNSGNEDGPLDGMSEGDGQADSAQSGAGARPPAPTAREPDAPEPPAGNAQPGNVAGAAAPTP